jgi:putative redox protein
MSEKSLRSVTVERIGLARFRATNSAGDTLEVGEGGHAFSAVELLLTAMATCAACDVDYITSRRAEPTSFSVEARGDKIRDQQGNRLVNMEVTFRVAFPEGDAGDLARRVLRVAISQSRARLCTVSRTVQVANEVGFRTAEPA